MKQSKEKGFAKVYVDLRAIWQSWVLKDFQADCFLDTKMYKTKVDNLRVFKLLSGLNPRYDQVRAQILGKDPFSHSNASICICTKWRIKKEGDVEHYLSRKSCTGNHSRPLSRKERVWWYWKDKGNCIIVLR